MKYGIGFATSGAFSNPELLAHLATTAERCGFESLWSVEHVAIPVKHLPYPGSKDGQMAGGDDVAIPDPLIPLAYVAAITKTLKLGTGVLILPQRHPIYTAKEVATVDVLSGGRVMLGIGSGWMKEEFESLGINFHHRGARTDEAIQALRALWSSGTSTFEGKPNSVRCIRIRSRSTRTCRFTSAETRQRPQGARDVMETAFSRPLRIRKNSKSCSRSCERK
ncbi:MAG TPA: TIGR03619 family F420-dependent LLM class oxidoreductase, partial [Methylomirabilota bacterium]|nr:TIGR03619 family F420-dependent LLM class oxidoreductase [Methylomirabilota bacterium]